uniref:type-F conjugative transfer system pilin assembly protein TrbC n=1 Tax=Hafnia alvei TaxID=569 RepID=UPI00242BCF33|nr:type-F conjugative transfer system pilin assembly protein TrbC [Hafnia alvei]
MKLIAIVMMWLCLPVLASPNADSQLNTRQINTRLQQQITTDREWLKQQENISEQLRNKPHPEMENWLKQQMQNNQLNNQDRSFIHKLAQQQQQQAGQNKPDTGAIYFVSFSIPEAGLQRMLAETRRYGIPATLRGLVNNDMKQTVDAVSQLVQNGATEGVQIDPTLYSQYGITSVPALVVRCDKGFDVIRGNLKLEQALQKMVSDGDCGDVAQQLLDRGGQHG